MHLLLCAFYGCAELLALAEPHASPEVGAGVSHARGAARGVPRMLSISAPAPFSAQKSESRFTKPMPSRILLIAAPRRHRVARLRLSEYLQRLCGADRGI
jgi:hypothetical protein